MGLFDGVSDFLFGGGDDPPAAPDPNKTVEAQARANRLWAFTPTQQVRFGTVGEGGEFLPTTGEDQAAVRVDESPFMQAMRSLQEAGGLGIADNILFSQGVPDRMRIEDVNGDTLARSTYEQGLHFLQPAFEDRQRRTEQRLADRGLPVGGEAFSDTMGDVYRAEDDALRQLALQSINAGRAEESRQFQLGSAERSNALQEIAMVLGGQGFQPAPVAIPGVAQVDVTGPLNAQYAGQLAAFQADQARSNAGTSSLFSLAGTLGAAAL